MYQIIGNNPLTKNIIDYALYWDYPTTQHLRLYDSSELNFSSGEGENPGVTHTRNQVTINGCNICVDNDSWVDTACTVHKIKYFIVNISNYLVSNIKLKNSKNKY